ncbi:hypothetical protein [Pseudomonas sp. DC3000-4b1]|uniref:hypothetical protein n=1 Tax=unclassified Pseudomonas TaxID=196821 RepID=UPI003CFAB1E9
MLSDSAVLGPGLLSFGTDISERERMSVIHALRFAQQAAWDAYPGNPAGDWFDHFCRQLRWLGWDARPPQPYTPSRSRQRLFDTAVEALALNGPRFRQVAAMGIEALLQNRPGLLLFERYARRHHHGMFQIMPCARARLDNGTPVLDMLLYHEELDMRDASPGCFTREAPPPLISCRLGVVRFGIRAFETAWLPKIEARFAKPWEDERYMRLLVDQPGKR